MGNDPGANPYWNEYAIALALLVIGFVQWRRIRPKREPMLSCFAAVGGLVAWVAMEGPLWFVLDVRSRDVLLMPVVKASLFAAACLHVDVALSRRRACPLPRVIVVRASGGPRPGLRLRALATMLMFMASIRQRDQQPR